MKSFNYEYSTTKMWNMKRNIKKDHFDGLPKWSFNCLFVWNNYVVPRPRQWTGTRRRQVSGSLPYIRESTASTHSLAMPGQSGSITYSSG